MKKTLINILITIILSTSFIVVSAGNSFGGTKEFYPINVNGVLLSTQIEGVCIEEVVYLPLKEFCNIFCFDAKWDSNTKTVNISFSCTPDTSSNNEDIVNKTQSETQQVSAVKNPYPILIEGSPLSSAGNGIIVEDRIYLPVESFSIVTSLEVKWNPVTRTVEIKDDTTPILERGDKVDEENPIFREGISEETALLFAHALFKQHFGEDYLEGKAVSIEEKLDGTVFLANLHYDDIYTDGGDCSIVIRKADGKILRVYWGE